MKNMNPSANVTSDEDITRCSQRDEYMTVNLTSTKVYKKSAQNNKITLYLGTRDLIISNKSIDKIQGVVYVDPDYLQDKKVFGQVTLTFRYGREDEEVMGLKFCNEAIMCLAQLYPPHERFVPPPMSPLQEALLKRLGENAHAFTMEVTPMAPPSVQLVPAKEYNGAPIGTSYDVRAFVAHRADEKLPRRNIVRMGIRVIQLATLPPKSSNSVSNIGPTEDNPPHALINKPFLLTDGKVKLEASLDKSFYSHGDSIKVNIAIGNNTKRSIRRIKIFVIQHVDVCMFSNGKFKNIVAMVDSREDCPIRPGCTFDRIYILNPAKGVTKNWIALEDSYIKVPSSLASTVVCNSPEERNVFAIYVSYYVKVKLVVGAMRSKFSVKLPFTLTHSQLPDEDVLLTNTNIDQPIINATTGGNLIGSGKLSPPPTTSSSKQEHQCYAGQELVSGEGNQSTNGAATNTTTITAMSSSSNSNT